MRAIKGLRLLMLMCVIMIGSIVLSSCTKDNAEPEYITIEIEVLPEYTCVGTGSIPKHYIHKSWLRLFPDMYSIKLKGELNTYLAVIDCYALWLTNDGMNYMEYTYSQGNGLAIKYEFVKTSEWMWYVEPYPIIQIVIEKEYYENRMNADLKVTNYGN